MNDSEIIQRFRGLYSGDLAQKRRDAGLTDAMVPWQEVSWLGKFVAKCPMDLWVYQELLYETQPEMLLECGTSGAGSAFFFATIFDLIGKGHVITVDVDVYPHLRREHPRITYLVGDSTSEPILDAMREAARGKVTMVSLDSDHRYEHVKKEVEAYSQMVTLGQYMVVEDVGVYDAASAERPPHFAPAPLVELTGLGPGWGTLAVAEFCREHPEFVQDMARERHLMTSNIWLRRT